MAKRQQSRQVNKTTSPNDSGNPNPPNEEKKEEIPLAEEQPKEEVQELKVEESKVNFKDELEAFKADYQKMYNQTVKMAQQAKKEGIPTARRFLQFEKAMLRNAKALRIQLPSKFNKKAS